MNPIRILIADDHDVVREGLKALLAARPGFEVCGEAATGREAVAQARALKPHVVVLDFSLPELNGVEATRQIRRARPDTEVLILTMYDSETLAREAWAAGAGGFLLKTRAKNDLLAAVETLARHQPFFTGSLAALARAPAPTAGAAVPADRLTPREREIVQRIAEGRTSKDIARELRLSVKTVDTHRANVMRKLGLHAVSDLVRYAVRNRIAEA